MVVAGKKWEGGKTCFFLLGGEEEFLFFFGAGFGEIDGMMDLEELDIFLCSMTVVHSLY